MSLTRKVTLIVTLVFLASAAANIAIQQILIMPSFVTLEKETAVKNAERVLGAVDRELDQLTVLVNDWSHWTDSYTYVKGVNPDYAADNLDFDNTLDAVQLNFLGFYDIAGKTIWSRAEEQESRVPVDLEPLTEAVLPVDHPLLQHKNILSDIKGIIPTPRGPMLIVAGPILTSGEEGPIAGTLMMGRFLSDTAIERIGDLTKLSVAFKESNKPLNSANWTGTNTANQGLVHTELEMIEFPEKWQAQTTIIDIFNNPILTLQIDTPRDISAQGAKAVNQSLWVLGATGMLMMFLLWKILQQALLKPIALLTEHALRIGEDDNLQSRLDLKRNDEVGILAHTFDQMVDRLAETRRRLIDQSYRSGIAEMASGVLHNIGNAITPLNIRLTTLQQELATVPLAEMELATTELADPSTPAVRCADLVQFMELAGGEMASLLRDSQEKVAASIKQVGQVQEILSDQQRFSRSARVIEPVDMAAVIKEAGAGLSPETKDTLRIEVTPSVTEIGVVAGSRAALQQVVTNLILNAAESIQSAGTVPGRVTVTAEYETLQGQAMVGLRFKDNGAGINPDHLGRLFERGFSTKNREGSGYGLHWCANTVQALGGKISAENVTTGHGACMHVLLPVSENVSPKTAIADMDHNGLPN